MNKVFSGAELRSLVYRYPHSTHDALDKISLTLNPGDYVSVLGANGSGKSTLLKLFVGLSRPSSGTLRLFSSGVSESGIDPATDEGGDAARSLIGLVTQNADDQLIAGTVEDDAAFGPINLGLDAMTVSERTEEALRAVGLLDKRRAPTHSLSGGERQKLAIAGVLALGCPVLALDEPLSMLDPQSRLSILDTLDRLMADGKVSALIHVTHALEEACRSRRALVLHHGRLVFDAAPAELFDLPLENWGLKVPEALRRRRELSVLVPGFVSAELDAEAVARELRLFLRQRPELEAALKETLESVFMEAPITQAFDSPLVTPSAASPQSPAPNNCCSDKAFVCEDLVHVYQKGTLLAGRALDGATLALPRGAAIALVGVSASGKTTLLKHGNAVLLPSSGAVRIFGLDPTDPKTDLHSLRLRAVLAVQSPESALFKRTIGDDVAYGPRNKGLRGQGLVASVKQAMAVSGLPYAAFRDRDPLSLSGGEKRKAALAGVFALDPEAYLLDEPTAGLDSASRDSILNSILALKERGKCVVASLHNMDDAARFDYVAVLVRGRVAAFGKTEAVFGSGYDPSWGLSRPWVFAFRDAYRRLCLNQNQRAVRTGIGVRRDEAPSVGRFIKPSSSYRDGAKRPCAVFGFLPFIGAKKRRFSGLEFYRNLNFGQFLDRPSPLRSLSAAKKTILSLAAFIAVFASSAAFSSASPPLQALIPAAIWPAFIVLAAKFFGAVPFSFLSRNLIPVLPYLILIAIFQSVFSWAGDDSLVFFALGPISFTVAEAIRSALLGLRLAAFVLLFTLLFAVTPMSDFAAFFRFKARTTPGAARRAKAWFSSEGLTWKRALGLVFVLAFRLIPVLQEEAERIAVAQASRGASYTGKGRFRSGLATALPLFLRALERAEALAVALELRLFVSARSSGKGKASHSRDLI